MFGGGMPGGPSAGPPGAGGPDMFGKGAKKVKKELPKLIDDDSGKNILKVSINKVYNLYIIVNRFFKSSLWFISCMSMMYLFPIGLEYYQHQMRMFMKLEA